MSRFDDYDYDEYFPNQGELWRANVQRALTGRRGKKALAELRDALLALPEKRLIAGALCTIGGAEQRTGNDPRDFMTAEAGRKAGLTFTLASTLAYRNDSAFDGMTPEQRYVAFMEWLDEQLADRVAA